MKRMFTLFSSMKIGFLGFILLAAAFLIGNRLSGQPGIKQVMKKMTALDIWSCWHDIFANPLLFFWIVFLVGSAAIIFINTICCTFEQVTHCFSDSGNKRFPGRLKLMAFVHIVAVVVIVFHVLDVALIERHAPVKAYTGDRIELGGYQLEVNRISYATDRNYIRENKNGRKMPFIKIPSDHFSIESNMAEVSFYKRDKFVEKREVRVFEPVRIGGDFFFLAGFSISYGHEDIGVSLHHSYNPLVIPFFVMYAILFTGLLVLCLAYRYKPVRAMR